ncbi:unnamed protein product [Dibothriocephalus latus]|uniref:Uncharacterized protein n=1 Tax=Dibothriocephalus latus TaxID=60516 RepID=A0A3P7PCL8_DIBLA|nr:unnamed protein product [Dibothriocephalus latus]
MASEAWSTDVLASDTESVNRGGASIGDGASSTVHSSIPTLPSISVSASAMAASNSAAISHPNASFRPGLHTRCQQTSSPTQRLLTASTGTNSSFQPPSASNRLRRRRRHHHHHHYHQFGDHAHVGGGGLSETAAATKSTTATELFHLQSSRPIPFSQLLQRFVSVYLLT